MTKLLFVCLGNICRSPAAEGVMTKFIADLELAKRLACDSAGTSAYHAGHPADARMSEFAKARGYELHSTARQFELPDFRKFDLILTMDSSNFGDILAMDSKREFTNKIRPFVDFCTDHTVGAVPDPYFGGDQGFELVMDIVEDGCRGILEHLKNEKKIT